MHLLDTTTFELGTGDQPNVRYEGYAILSHRWVGEEISFRQLPDVVAELRSNKAPGSTPQIEKIRGACKIARDSGFRWLWIDSCCIDKSNAVEFDETIRSMYNWYRDARICITYLNDVDATGSWGPRLFNSIERDGPSFWFSRGWTLQELLAPSEVRFYDRNWEYIGTRHSHAQTLSQITGIATDYLLGAKDILSACVATKMSWMAGRTTTRPEDIAYSMLGIFNVHMNTRYGEGMEAFIRLQQELLTASHLTADESIFAWRMPAPHSGGRFLRSNQEADWLEGEWGLLAPSPDWFKDSGGVTVEQAHLVERQPKSFDLIQGSVVAWIPTAGGTKTEAYLAALSIITFMACFYYPLILPRMRTNRLAKDFEYPLNAYIRDEQGNLEPLRIWLRPAGNNRFYRVKCTEFAQGRSERGPRRGRVQQEKVLQPILRNTDDGFRYKH
ncbi:HET-domain-containing protein [Nemania sp. FL0031]|nr:HET-domain-containing protein [Nemania sp. FL0031]